MPWIECICNYEVKKAPPSVLESVAFNRNIVQWNASYVITATFACFALKRTRKFGKVIFTSLVLVSEMTKIGFEKNIFHWLILNFRIPYPTNKKGSFRSFQSRDDKPCKQPQNRPNGPYMMDKSLLFQVGKRAVEFSKRHFFNLYITTRLDTCKMQCRT